MFDVKEIKSFMLSVTSSGETSVNELFFKFSINFCEASFNLSAIGIIDL